MDVHALVVRVEERLEAFREGVAGGGAVGGADVGIVAGPMREEGVGEEEGAGGRGGGEEFAG